MNFERVNLVLLLDYFGERLPPDLLPGWTDTIARKQQGEFVVIHITQFDSLILRVMLLDPEVLASRRDKAYAKTKQPSSEFFRLRPAIDQVPGLLHVMFDDKLAGGPGRH